MTTASKKVLKTCGNPKCKFKKCWIHAPKCEECGWDFKLQRMPRTTKAADIDFDDDDIQLPPPPEQPKVTVKPCPECGHKCWHAAPICENCDYDFVNKLSKRQKEEKASRKKKHHEDEEPETPKKVSRAALGARPRFFLMEREPWMDEYDGNPNNLRAWAANFLRKLREKFSSHIFAGSVLDWAEDYSKNPKLRDPKTTTQLCEWFGVKRGIVTWKRNPHSEMLEDGFILTDEEAQAVIRDSVDSWAKQVSVEQRGKMADGREYTYLTMMDTEDAAKHRAASKINYIMLNGYGGSRSLAILPDDWNKRSYDAKIAWFYAQGCSPAEGIPTGDMVKSDKGPRMTKEKAKK